MRRLLTVLFLQCAVLSLYAQDSIPVLKFGYLSYEQALKAMPDYTLAEQTFSDLRAQYDAEQQRVERDFNLKYEEFLEGMRDFPETILRKRQTELKELLERNIAFRNESRQQLKKAEAEIFAPLRARLDEELARIGLERGYAFILNTDANAAPFVSPLMGEDINLIVKDAFQ